MDTNQLDEQERKLKSTLPFKPLKIIIVVVVLVLGIVVGVFVYIQVRDETKDEEHLEVTEKKPKMPREGSYTNMTDEALEFYGSLNTMEIEERTNAYIERNGRDEVPFNGTITEIGEDNVIINDGDFDFVVIFNESTECTVHYYDEDLNEIHESCDLDSIELDRQEGVTLYTNKQGEIIRLDIYYDAL